MKKKVISALLVVAMLTGCSVSTPDKKAENKTAKLVVDESTESQFDPKNMVYSYLYDNQIYLGDKAYDINKVTPELLKKLGFDLETSKTSPKESPYMEYGAKDDYTFMSIIYSGNSGADVKDRKLFSLCSDNMAIFAECEAHPDETTMLKQFGMPMLKETRPGTSTYVYSIGTEGKLTLQVMFSAKGSFLNATLYQNEHPTPVGGTKTNDK